MQSKVGGQLPRKTFLCSHSGCPVPRRGACAHGPLRLSRPGRRCDGRHHRAAETWIQEAYGEGGERREAGVQPQKPDVPQKSVPPSPAPPTQAAPLKAPHGCFDTLK